MNFLLRLFGPKKEVFKRGNLAFTDKEEIGKGWSRIEELKTGGKPSSFRQAVIEADKLVDFALDKLYPTREGMAERLKAGREMFLNDRDLYEKLWYAHKLRNELVHSVGFELPSFEAKNLLDDYKKVLEKLGGL